MARSRTKMNSQLTSARVSEYSTKQLSERDRKSTRLNSSHSQISYAVFCLKKKKDHHTSTPFPSLLILPQAIPQRYSPEGKHVGPPRAHSGAQRTHLTARRARHRPLPAQS